MVIHFAISLQPDTTRPCRQAGGCKIFTVISSLPCLGPLWGRKHQQRAIQATDDVQGN